MVETTGKVRRIERQADGGLIEVKPSEVFGRLEEGDSVSVSGVCLTVVEAGGGAFRAQVSPETHGRTTLSELKPGDQVNLEQALKADSRIGGHLVTGHVDGVGRVRSRLPKGNSIILSFAVADKLMPEIVARGSVAVDGVSLTVTKAGGGLFEVSIIPYTATKTTLGALRVGRQANIETDLVAKYVRRMTEKYEGSGSRLENLTTRWD